MKTKITTILFLVLAISLGYSQTVNTYYGQFESSKFEQTYDISLSIEGEIGENSIKEISATVRAFMGQGDGIRQDPFIEKKFIMGLRNFEKTGNSSNPTYMIKTDYKDTETVKELEVGSEFHEYELFWGFNPKLKIQGDQLTIINDNVVSDMQGKGEIVLEKSNGNTNLKESEKFLADYGTMNFMYDIVDEDRKQYNRVYLTVKQNDEGKFKLNALYNVWKGKNKKRLKDKLVSVELDFDITDIFLTTDNNSNKVAYLTVKNNKNGTDYALQPSDDFDGYYYQLALAIVENREWYIDPARGMLFETQGEDSAEFVFYRDYAMSELDKLGR